MKYLQIDLNERRRIEYHINKGLSIRRIAQILNRSASSISEEIKKNSVNGKYIASKAHHKATQRRKKSKIQCMKVAMNKELKEYVIENIRNEQTPEGISKRLKQVDKNIEYVSTKGIYKFIHSVHGRQIERHLYSKVVKKKGGVKRGSKDETKVCITKRPQKIENRIEFGHFEGDYIESGKNGEGSILVLVERKTRYPFLLFVNDKSTENINKQIFNLVKDVPIKSLTIDNDISFQKHQKLSNLIQAPIYFTRPYTSQDKGSVERLNKSLRRYFPKRSDLSSFSDERIKEVEEKLRNKFMICLNGLTPLEAWSFEIEKLELKKAHCRNVVVGYY